MLKQQDHSTIFRRSLRGNVLTAGILLIATHLCAQKSDTSRMLQKIIIRSNKQQALSSAAISFQQLNEETLQWINAGSVAEAARYFSGVLVNDYGGVGGLKTVSVRGMGALNTGVLYDGIPVADVQTGQIDLSKFSTTFIQHLELDQANAMSLLQPARAYAYASMLAIHTRTYELPDTIKTMIRAGLTQGSFGLWQPFAGMCKGIGNRTVLSASAEMIASKGDYPYYIKNGSLQEKRDRTNSDVQAYQGEINLMKKFRDSASWQTKLGIYQSERGLPGSIIFFNDIAVQRLWDKDVFLQSCYHRELGKNTSLLLSAKYSYLYTRYRDPNFLNNAGGLDDRYKQQEIYGSAALSHKFGSSVAVSLASDIASTHLNATIKDFVNPSRICIWNVLTAKYTRSRWQWSATLLNTLVADHTHAGTAATNKQEYTPVFAASYKTAISSPFIFRAFYKDIFRQPTFNDLYYTYISNINPKLRPEYTQQYDIGTTYFKDLQGRIRQLSFSMDAYYNAVKDKIIGVPGQNLFIWTMTNLDKVRVLGTDIHAELKGDLSATVKGSIRIAYTWQQALNMTDPSTAEYKNEIPYTPEHSGSAITAITYKKWEAGYNVLFSGSRYALGENNASDKLAPWVSQDIFIARSFIFSLLDITVRAAVDNLFDDRYEVIQYYPMPGRSYKLSITFINL